MQISVREATDTYSSFLNELSQISELIATGSICLPKYTNIVMSTLKAFGRSAFLAMLIL